LLVAFIPGLLMLATFGLDRLEAGLDRDTVSATDVAEFLEQAGADDVHTLARDGMPEALDCMHRRLNGRDSAVEVPRSRISFDEWPNLPTPQYAYNNANPEFQPSRHANRV
jgi:hypothetical protein